jgi:hypothetical protein
MPLERVVDLPYPQAFRGVEDVRNYLVNLRTSLLNNMRNNPEDLETQLAQAHFFKTITGITNDVVADQRNDTLTLASGAAALTIVGTAGTDTITWDLSLLGMEDLVDPNADRLPFWDDGAGKFDWLVPNIGVEVSGTNLNVKYDNSTIKVNGSNQLYADVSVIGSGIGSNPGSGEYRITGLRLDSSKRIVVTYDETPMP